MTALLPVGEHYELLSEEDENLIPYDTPTDGNYFYILSIDYYTPYDVKRVTYDLPMSVKQEIITDEKLSLFSNKLVSDINHKLGKQKILIASHDPQEKYLISLSSAFDIISCIRFENNKN